MIGANKPSWEVTVEGLASGITINSSRAIQGIDSTTKYVSNWVAKTSGGYICTWMDATSKSLRIGHSQDLEFTSQDHAIESVTESPAITTDWVSPKQTALCRRNGKLLLFLSQVASAAWVKCYISNNGNGDDWVYLSTVHSVTTTNADGGTYILTPFVTSTGRILLPFYNKSPSNSYFSQWLMCASDDIGATWSIKISQNPITTPGRVDQPCEKNGVLYCLGKFSSVILKSIDNGDTWTEVADFNSGFSDVPTSDLQGISFYYDEITNITYALCLATQNNAGIYTLSNFADFEDKTKWVKAVALGDNTGYGEVYKIGNQIVFQGNNFIISSSYMTIAIPVKSISINRNKNMAGSLAVTVDNKNGEWSPDGVKHPKALWPNTQIAVKQGYGVNLIQTFSGLMDNINLSTFPAEIKLGIRDKLKLALDQTITSGTSHVIIYIAQTIEAIFTDLCSKAGLIVGTVEATGLTLAEKSFSWESYGDCFSWLADLVGFEFVCDELGVVHFRKETNTQPASDDEAVIITSGAGQLEHYPIVQYSEVLTDGVSTIYVRDTDYTIDYETGEITSITIADGTIYADYVYAAYVFKEGEDIVSLGYTIDDNDLYYEVVVYGKAEDDTVISAIAAYASRDYYNILPQKIMKIDASDATTVEQCQAIANRAAELMSSKARIVSFAAIAVPWLQVGDVIRVIESSTTISELYRITDLSTTQDSNGYLMQITCYHHSYA
jgi:hypothetical protein